jgi:hypothetical protein
MISFGWNEGSDGSSKARERPGRALGCACAPESLQSIASSTERLGSVNIT